MSTKAPIDFICSKRRFEFILVEKSNFKLLRFSSDVRRLWIGWASNMLSCTGIFRFVIARNANAIFWHLLIHTTNTDWINLTDQAQTVAQIKLTYRGAHKYTRTDYVKIYECTSESLVSKSYGWMARAILSRFVWWFNVIFNFYLFIFEY